MQAECLQPHMLIVVALTYTEGGSLAGLLRLVLSAALSISIVGYAWPDVAHDFQFALLGDRTGEAQPGVFQEVWREAASENPAFVLTVGDTIQGGDDHTIDAQWLQVLKTLAPYRRFQLFLTPGNHDVWDAASKSAFEKYAQHPLHYSFDWQAAHFTVLNDSESDNLEKDLASHNAQPVKFIISHRPAWLFSVALGDGNFPLHQLALRYGVKYVIAGHLHQMLHFKLDGITYLSMASSGGHLRNDKAYEHGWFFQHTSVTVSRLGASFKIQELSAPYGKARVTSPADWGVAGLMAHR